MDQLSKIVKNPESDHFFQPKIVSTHSTSIYLIVHLLAAQHPLGRSLVIAAGEGDQGHGDFGNSLQTGNAGPREAAGVVGLVSVNMKTTKEKRNSRNEKHQPSRAKNRSCRAN
jgi:hypothetical protein